MDNELKMKIRNTIGKINQAVQGMMQPDIDDEEKNGWIMIYNGAMRKIMNDYLAEEPLPDAPAEDPVEGEETVDVADVAEDAGVTDAE